MDFYSNQFNLSNILISIHKINLLLKMFYHICVPMTWFYVIYMEHYC